MGYNLISILKDISSKIGNIIIPDPNAQLSDIVTAVQNINIQAVASDAVAVDGSRWNPAGNYVADLDLFWEGIGHVNTSTLHHPQGAGHGIVIAARNGAGAIQIYIPIDAYTDNTDPTVYMRFTQYANLGNWVNPWDYLYLASYYMKYTDNNNIGATNVQRAVDFFGSYSEGDATLNTSYLSGQARWQKMGKLVTLFYEITVNSNLPTSGWDTKLITNLPPIRTPFANVRRWSTPSDITTKPPLVFAATNSSGYETTTLYNWGNGSGNTGGTYRGGLEYFTF